MHPPIAMARKTISAAVVVAIAAAALLVVPLSVAGDPSPAPVEMPNCVASCSGVDVPYPFGIGPDASRYHPGFNLTCDDTSRPGESRLLLDADGTLQVLDISLQYTLLQAQHSGDVKIDSNGSGTFGSRDGQYRLSGSTELYNSELILTGCNVQATVKNGNGVTVASCTSLCGSSSDNHRDDDGENSRDPSPTVEKCSGGSTGCCRGDIITPAYDGHGGYDGQLTWLGLNRSADLEWLVVQLR